MNPNLEGYDPELALRNALYGAALGALARTTGFERLGPETSVLIGAALGVALDAAIYRIKRLFRRK